MTQPQNPVNRVRARRTALGITQAQLAQRAGVSRTAITAIEGNRLVPSVATALALANVLNTTVESLFGPEAEAPRAAAWAWQPPSESRHFWEAEVGGHHWLYPAGSAPMLTALPDGVAGEAELHAAQASTAGRTLVLASCDPAAGILASQYWQATGMRLLVIPRSSREAVELLKQNRVHLAGLHLSTRDDPEQNARFVRDQLGTDYYLLRVACWQEGIATDPASRITTVRGAVRGRLNWVGREAGSGARQCLDRLLGERHRTRLVARNHRSVAEAVKLGWADAGVCVQLVGSEAGLDFLAVEDEAYDLCFPSALLSDRRVKALIDLVRSSTYRKLLGSLPGYSTSLAGTLTEVR